jgi:hypothetical protein
MDTLVQYRDCQRLWERSNHEKLLHCQHPAACGYRQGERPHRGWWDRRPGRGGLPGRRCTHAGDKITVYEQLLVTGGALDGAGDHQTGYTARGDREQHESMASNAEF